MSRLLLSCALAIGGAGIGAGCCTMALVVFADVLAWPAILWAGLLGAVGCGALPWLDP